MERTIIEYLSGVLNVPVYGEVPGSPENQFVVIDKTGSATENYITTITIAIQSYANTKYEASDLNETVIKAMETMPHYGGIHLITDYQFNNPAVKRYRYQALFEITFNRRANNE